MQTDVMDRPAVVVVNTSRFVTIDLASAKTGLTPAAIRAKIAKAEWLEGRQYIRRDGRVYIDMQGYEQWVAKGQA